MRRIGRLRQQCLAPHIVKAQHKVRIARESFWRCHILDIVLLPQTSGIAESIDPAFSGNAGSSEYDDVAKVSHVAHEAW